MSKRGGCCGDRLIAGARKGLTLIEVILAAAVLAFGLTASIICIQLSVHDVDVARTSTAVSQAMQNELERLRMDDWAEIASLPPKETLDLKETFSADSVLNGKVIFVREVSDVTGFTDMKEIVVRASWTSIVDGQSHSRTYRMRYTKNGLHDYYYSSNVEI